MKKTDYLFRGLALAGVLMAGQAMAASDGTLGATSTGTSLVSLTINDRVQISSVADIPLGAYIGTGTMTGQSTYCVHRNGGGNYQLTLTADTGAFQVDSASAVASIPFAVAVDDDLDASAGGETLTYNTASAVALVGSNSVTCGGADNAAMYVSFAEVDLQAAPPAADYQATVTLLVEPI